MVGAADARRVIILDRKSGVRRILVGVAGAGFWCLYEPVERLPSCTMRAFDSRGVKTSVDVWLG